MHELQVHQTELDMQNQELRRAQEAIEEARSRYEALYDFAPVGYFTLSRKGKITQVNLTGAGLLGVQRSLLIDQPFHLWLAPEFREAFRTHLQKVFETGGQQTCELKILRHDGTHLHILMESTTQPDAPRGPAPMSCRYQRHHGPQAGGGGIEFKRTAAGWRLRLHLLT